MVLHLLLLLLLSYSSEPFSPPKNTVELSKKKTAIKSYLYKLPAKKVTTEARHVLANEKTSIKINSSIAVKAIPQEQAVNIVIMPSISAKIKTTEKTTQQISASANASSDQTQKNKSSFSAYNQLNKLRVTIQQNIINQELAQQQRHKSASVMHAKQIPVPHSVAIISAEQQKKTSTMNYSNQIAITKNDNGTCTIEQDLSNAAMQGLTSRQMFICGESKFDKNFRQHMKKVRSKLGK